jgi:exopolysaccharide biosynthesis polyprenyl glycosylphosphotransferase
VRGSRSLRLKLVGLDFLTALVTWLVVISVHKAHALDDTWSFLPVSLVLALVTSWLIWTQHLYRSRVCAVRSSELNRLFRVAVAAALLASVWHKFVVAGPVTPATATVGAACVFLTLAGGRSVFTGWLRLRRLHGDYARPVCVIGTNDEAEALVHLLMDHRELGFRVAGVVGDEEEWAGRIPDVDILPAGRDPSAAVLAARVTGVVIATTALSSVDRDRLLRRLMAAGVHIHLSSGLTRFGQNRIRMMPLAHHPAFYVEPQRLSLGQALVKRALDVCLSGLGLVMVSPVLLLSALAVKLQDGGSVFYQQERVGLKGCTFRLLKLRTMVPDAAQRLGELAALNERQGPLFKVARDPRVTRVGHFLRSSSIDELPQLFNVLKGEMSLVGPRPALPAEFAQFDADLVERALVPPGITGLWQVEARDNPSFRAYRRLDLFYVDNWSLGFDLAIMIGTARMLIGRTSGALWDPLHSHLTRRSQPSTDLATPSGD